MKQISLWAYHHKWASRILIVFSHIILFGLALFLADILALKNISLTAEFLFVIIGVIAIAFYPQKNNPDLKIFIVPGKLLTLS
jgi:phosphoglycerol transferase MdoB-like AlkP superfamily enzyme